MDFWLYLLLIIFILVLIYLLICHLIGSKFLNSLKRQKADAKPGFAKRIDLSFYLNGPLKKIAAEGLKYMETLTHEDVWVTSFDDLKLHATLFPCADTKKFVIGIHGFKSKAWHEYAPYLKFYRSCGYGMLLVDDRAHGQSAGKYVTMGVKDRFDCLSWANYLVDRYGKEVELLLHGVSMGAATVLSASGEKDLPPQIKGIISDCAYSSVEEAFAVQIETLFKIPSPFILKICKRYAKRYADFDFDEATPLHQVAQAKVPILFVQGTADFLVPAKMAEELYAACGSRKKLLMVEGANHAESIAVATEEYQSTIREFFGI